MPKGDGVLTRIVALVRAMLPEDWRARAGGSFRGTTEAVSRFAEEHNVTPKEVLSDAVDLGRRKLEGLANKEYADAFKAFAEGEQTKLETELQRRSSQSRVRQEEATARLAELKVVDAEIELLKKLQENRVILHRDENGNLTALPLPPGCDFHELEERWRSNPPALMPAVGPPTGTPVLQDPRPTRRGDPRYIDGQRLLVEAMKYLAQSDPISNRPAIELLSDHVRTRFRMSDSPPD
jgi:hypothetical protein